MNRLRAASVSILVSLALLLAFASGTAAAAPTPDLVVDDDGVECPGADHTSIQNAVDNASSGALIHVCSGEYQEQVGITTSVTLRANETAVVNGQNLPNGSAFTVAADNVVVDNFTVTNYTSSGNVAEGNGVFSLSSGASNVTVANNTLANLQGNGVALGSTSAIATATNITVRNNTIANVSDNGILVANAEGVTVTNNSVIGNRTAGNTQGPSTRGILVLSRSTSGSTTLGDVDLLDNNVSGPFAASAVTIGSFADSGTTANASGLTVDGNIIDANDSSAPGLVVLSGGAGSADVSSVTVTGNLVTGNGSSAGVVVRASSTGTISNALVRENVVNSTQTGLVLDASDKASVSAVNVSRNLFNETSANALRLTAGEFGNTSATGTVRNVTVTENALNESAGVGLNIAPEGAGTVETVDVSRNLLDLSAIGVRIGQINETTVRNVEIARNIIENNTRGVSVDTGDSATKDNLYVYFNSIENNTDGVFLSTATSGEGLRVQRNLLGGNVVGVNNQNNSSVVRARYNFWGDDSGPSGSVTDPVTGTLANGTGSAVTENGTTGVSNVAFDPWIGKATCQGDEFLNVTSRISNETVTLGNVEFSIARLATVCAWERSPLPLRTDDGDAATSVRNLNAFVRFDGDDDGTKEDVPINRPRLSVYQQGQSFDLQYRNVSFADTSKFAGEDVQLVAVKRGTGDLSQFDTAYNNSTGVLSLESDAVDIEVLDDAAGVGTLDSNGEITASYTPSTTGVYTFALVRVDYGNGLSVAGSSNLSLDGGVTVVGVEAAQVQSTSSTASPTQSSFQPGENVTFSVDSNLGTTNVNHSVILYDGQTFASQTLVVSASNNTTITDLLTGNVTGSDLVIERSFDTANGIARVDSEGTFLGLEVPNETFSGSTGIGGLVSLVADSFGVEEPTQVVTGDAQINASTTVVLQTDGSRTISVGTFQNFSDGTYRYVHIAEKGSGTTVSSTTGTVTLQTVTSGPGGGGGGGGAGGGGGGPGLIGPPSQESDIQVVSADVSPTTVEPGAPVEITAVVENQGSGGGTATIRLFVDGEHTGDSRFVTLDAGETTTIEFTERFDEPGSYTINVGGVRAGTVTVAGATPGTTAASPTTPATPTTPTTDTAEPGEPPTTVPLTYTPPTETPSGGPLGGTGSTVAIVLGIIILLGLLGGAIYFLALGGSGGGMGGNPPGQ